MYHYVYKLQDPLGYYYFGSRSCNNLPSEDKYLGSMCTWKPNKNELTKEIIESKFSSREEAIIFERGLILQHIKNPFNKNFHIPGKNFFTLGRTGFVPVKDQFGNKFQVEIDDDRYLSGELVHVSKGKVMVKDKNGNYLSVLINDQRYLSGELVSINAGKSPSEKTRNKISEKFSERQSGSGNTMYNRIWIYKDSESKAVLNIELNEYLSNGWKRGRKIGKIWINNGAINEFINVNDFIKYDTNIWNRGKIK